MNYDILRQIKHISEWIPALNEELNARGTAPEISIKSLPHLNRGIWGLKRKALTIIGARTSQGKSAFALQLAWDVAQQGIPVWLLSLEMDVLSLLERLFCHVFKIDNYSVLSGQFRLDKGIQENFVKFQKLLEDSKLLLACGLGKTWQDINYMIEHISDKDKPKVIIVDYIQNIASAPGDTRERINEYIREFRDMAIGNNFAGILCSQINRGAEEQKDKIPSLAQLKESGFLEESADTVLLLHWKGFYERPPKPNPEDKNEKPPKENWEYIVNVAKQRNGPTGDYEIVYTPKHYLFSEDILTGDLAGRKEKQEVTPVAQKIKDLFNAEEA